MTFHENDTNCHLLTLFEKLQTTESRLRELERSHALLHQEVKQSSHNIDEINLINERVLQLENKTKAMEKKIREYDS